MPQNVIVVINTNDMDDLDVEVFTLISMATEYVKEQLESCGASLDAFTDEKNAPIEERLKTWTPDEGDLDVWSDEGRVIFTLKGKHLHQVSDLRSPA